MLPRVASQDVPEVTKAGYVSAPSTSSSHVLAAAAPSQVEGAAPRSVGLPDRLDLVPSLSRLVQNALQYRLRLDALFLSASLTPERPGTCPAHDLSRSGWS